MCYHAIKGEYDIVAEVLEEIIAHNESKILKKQDIENLKKNIVNDTDLIPMKDHPTFLKFKNYKFK